MAASTTRNRMTRPKSARPVQTNGREVVSVDVFDAATWNMFKLRSQGKRSHRFGLLSAHRGHRRLDIHPQRLEDMAIEVLEVAAVHKAVILLGPGVGLAAGAHGFLDNRIDALAAVERQAEEGLDLAFCIDDPLRSEVGEVRVAQDHEDDRFGPFHRAGAAGLAKALILYEADSFVKSDGLLYVGDGQVDENHLGHGGSGRSGTLGLTILPHLVIKSNYEVRK